MAIRSTIKDVARASGVSPTTVSFVLNNSRAVGAETHARVLAAAHRLGYTANPLARGLSTGRSHTLGLLLPDLNITLMTQIVMGVEQAAREHGYKILPVFHHENVEQALQSLPDLSARRLDGLLSTAWSAGEHPEIVSALPETGIPYGVVYYRAAPGANVDNVIVDHYQGATLAAEHLIGRGRKHIAYFGGLETREVTQERLRGLRDTVEKRGLPFRYDLVFFGDFSVESGVNMAKQLGALSLSTDRPRFDAVFAASDHIAAGALRVLRSHGLRVPDDVSVVGFNDHVIATATDPPLTSVQMPLHAIGMEAVKRLLLRLDCFDAWEAVTLALPCRLVVRESA